MIYRALVLAALLGCAGSAVHGAAGAAKSNILIIFSDDQGSHDVSCYVSSGRRVPHTLM